jgi:hypothetical protein
MTDPPTTRVPRVRFRFSLRTFLVSLLLLSLIGSNLYVSWRWNEARHEIERLREELGYLIVDDPTKFHVRAVPTHDPLSWRWRIYVPPGQHWFHMGIGRIAKTGLEAGSGSATGPSRPTNSLAGEFTMTARIERDTFGNWQLIVSWPGGSSMMSINERDAGWLPKENRGPHTQVRRKFHADVAGGRPMAGSARRREMESFPPDEPVVLLRLRAPADLATDTGQPCDGVMIWFDKGRVRRGHVARP